jgi:biopolymer transport protein ExbB
MENRISKFVLVFLSIGGATVIFLKVDLVRMGGPFMIPLLFCSIFAFAIVIAKMRQFAKEDIDAESLLKNIFERMERQRIKEALDLCDQSQTALGRILKAGIMKYDRPKDELKEAMQDSFTYEAPALEGNLSILSTIIQIAPLLGLLGTLAGFMKIFQIVQGRGLSSLGTGIADISVGIWQALISSAMGFLLAIPLLVASNYLSSRLKYFVEETERKSTELVNFLIDRRMSS